MSRRSERIRSREPTSTPPPVLLATQPEEVNESRREGLEALSEEGLVSSGEEDEEDAGGRKGKKKNGKKKRTEAQTEEDPNQLKCPVCLKKAPKKFHQHLLLSHPDHHYTPQELARTEFSACGCGKPVKGRRGFTQHRTTSGCTARIVDPRLGAVGASEPTATKKATSSSNRTTTDPTNIAPRERSNDQSTSQPTSGNWMPRTDRARLASKSPATQLLTEVEIEARHRRFLSLSCLPTTYKRLHPSVATAFKNKAGQLAAEFNAEPSEESLFHILALPKIALAHGLRSGRLQAIRLIAEFPAVQWPQPHTTTRANRSRAEVAVRHLESGRVGQAARALEDNGQIAPVTDEVIKALREKHPDGPPEPFSTPGSRHDTFPVAPEDDTAGQSHSSS
ncbi:hypothetical protein I203_102765 [Kwoniella mangroviensis CBS 8507]|uniref:uncharacterized protein n=1 Tax=Kwoniella mangroviensis CBS 8507 TaxID=1296122 RepID=UPI00303E2062